VADAWLSSFSTTLDITVFAFGGSDTIRGGKQVLVSAPTLSVLDSGLDESFAALPGAPPPGWSEIGSGDKNYEFTFTELETTPIPGTFSGLQLDSDLVHFDAAIDIDLNQPRATSSGQGSAVDVAIFRFDVPTAIPAASLIVQVERGPDAQLLVRAVMSAYGREIVGSGHIFDLDHFTLRIVRNRDRIWAFFGVRDSFRNYTTLVKLFDSGPQFAIEPGNLSIRVDNRLRAVNTKTRITNFTVESHARIGPRLLEEKAIRFSRAIGIVPAATLEEVGFAELVVFGLFGESIAPEGFEYTLPVPRTVGRELTRQLELYSDVQLRDGGE
jgi:hypothetical protein